MRNVFSYILWCWCRKCNYLWLQWMHMSAMCNILHVHTLVMVMVFCCYDNLLFPLVVCNSRHQILGSWDPNVILCLYQLTICVIVCPISINNMYHCVTKYPVPLIILCCWDRKCNYLWIQWMHIYVMYNMFTQPCSDYVFLLLC